MDRYPFVFPFCYPHTAIIFPLQWKLETEGAAASGTGPSRNEMERENETMGTKLPNKTKIEAENWSSAEGRIIGPNMKYPHSLRRSCFLQQQHSSCILYGQQQQNLESKSTDKNSQKLGILE